MVSVAEKINRRSLIAQRSKFIQCAALLLTAAFLFRSGMYASLSNLFLFHHPNSVATIWGNLDMTVALLLIPTAFASLKNWRTAAVVAITLATFAISIYLAQTLLIFVDRISDQTYLSLNPYLKTNPILPFLISCIALVTSMFRLKTLNPAHIIKTGGNTTSNTVFIAS